MKTAKILLTCLLYLLPVISIGQYTPEAAIRQLENAEREAILNADTLALAILMSPQIIINNPEHQIVGFDQVIARVKAGKINYIGFERVIEKITFVENLAIVMGSETIRPQGESKHAGKIVTRRFTNVWMKQKGRWRLTVRQATIISIQS